MQARTQVIEPLEEATAQRGELSDEERLDQAIDVIAEVNGRLDPDGMTVPRARRLLRCYARGQKVMAFGVATLAGKVDHAEHVAKVTGTSIGKAKRAERRLRPQAPR